MKSDIEEKKIRKIIAIIGDFCSGKHNIITYLHKKYNYEVYDYTEFSYKFQENRIEVLKDTEFKSQQLNNIIHNMNKIKIAFYPILSIKEIEKLRIIAPFSLIFISTPVKTRFENFKQKFPSKENLFTEFINKDYEFSSNEKFQKLKSMVDYIVNINTNDEMESKIDKLIEQLNKYRPNWDDYFMSVAHQVERRCNCVKSKVGAVIVKDNRIVSVGYNGTPSNIENCYLGNCTRCWSNAKSGVDLDKCICIHAEENAILEAGRKKCNGSKLYSTVCPCLTCAKHIIQCGIGEVIYDAEYNSELTEKIFKEAKVNMKKWKKSIENII